MLDHLDDPQAFTPDEAFRTAVIGRGRRRRLRRRLAATSASAVVLLAGAAGAVLVRADHHLDRVDRVEVAGLPEVEPAPSDPYTVLFVGSDSRAGSLGPADQEVVGGRSDTMILARVLPDDTVTVLPLPRDLWVDVPGHGAGRLNSAYAQGGPSLLTATIRADLGVTVDRYVELDFGGTRAIGDAIGGLRLSFAAAVRDDRTGLALDAGCRSLGGGEILALARARHLQYQRPDGSWAADPTSDLGRIERQQAIGVAALGALSHLDTSSPRQLDELLGVIARDLTVDSRMSNAEVVGLFRGIAGSAIVQLRLPVTDAEHGGAMVLERAAGADAVIAALGAAGPAGGPPTDTTEVPGSTTTTQPPTRPLPPTRPSPPASVVPTPC
ncbi:MAG: LytTR family transcriptional regulator [Acidimicrobiales bacterium]|nr:LytTR family transcriptional regulator [Acidimicrobiales bacterium]